MAHFSLDIIIFNCPQRKGDPHDVPINYYLRSGKRAWEGSEGNEIEYLVFAGRVERLGEDKNNGGGMPG